MASSGNAGGAHLFCSGAADAGLNFTILQSSINMKVPVTLHTVFSLLNLNPHVIIV